MRSRIVIAVAAIAVFFGIQAGQGVGADELLILNESEIFGVLETKKKK